MHEEVIGVGGACVLVLRVGAVVMPFGAVGVSVGKNYYLVNAED
jgi:hypothetical protein